MAKCRRIDAWLLLQHFHDSFSQGQGRQDEGAHARHCSGQVAFCTLSDPLVAAASTLDGSGRFGNARNQRFLFLSGLDRHSCEEMLHLRAPGHFQRSVIVKSCASHSPPSVQSKSNGEKCVGEQGRRVFAGLNIPAKWPQHSEET